MTTTNIFATSVFFKLVIGGNDLGAFHTCSGLGAEVELEQYAEGGNNGFAWQLPGRITWTNITLTRPVTADTSKIARWLNEIIQRVEPKDGEIVALRPDLGRIIGWQVQGIVPVRWQGPSFDPANSEAAVETLEIAHAGLLPS
ncbi:phage tail protein [Embleya sp. AB8]|uniref:phage tail protein n=1 Tax=Embleya sp. AB8 TaxID=3156304 RepID=UPI003C787482